MTSIDAGHTMKDEDDKKGNKFVIDSESETDNDTD
jgi:hypothetical protein